MISIDNSLKFLKIAKKTEIIKKKKLKIDGFTQKFYEQV